MSGDPVANVLRRQGKLTRANYLALEYMGCPPLYSDGQLPPELEAELPEELQAPDDILGLPINALLCDPLSEFDRILIVLLEER